MQNHISTRLTKRTVNTAVKRAERVTRGFLPILLTKRPPEMLPTVKNAAVPIVRMATVPVVSSRLCLRNDAPYRRDNWKHVQEVAVPIRQAQADLFVRIAPNPS